MSEKSKQPVLKIVITIFLIIILGAFGFSFYISQHYKQIILEKLPGWVAKSTDSVYFISVGDISINIITRRVTFDNIKIWADTDQVNILKQRGNAPSKLFYISIHKVQAGGISWTNMLTASSLDCKYLWIWQPKVLIEASPYHKDTLQQPNAPDTTKESGAMYIGRISIADIRVVNPDITYHFAGPKDSFYCYFKGGKAGMTNWLYIRDSSMNDTGFLHAQKGTIAIDSFIYKKPGSNYNIGSANVSFNSEEHSLTLQDLGINPSVSHEVFYQNVGHQKEIYNLNFPSVRLCGFDWRALMKTKMLTADTVVLDKPDLDIYLSRMYTPNTQSKKGKYPQQLLHKLKLQTNIKNIRITDGNLKYTEVNDKTQSAGIISFNNVSGHISNATNIDSLTAINKNCIVELYGDFMHKSPMTATFNFLLTDTTGIFTVDAALKELDESEIAEPALALAVTKIKSLHVSQMNMHIEGDQNSGKGNITMLYDKLDIELQKANSDADLSKRPVLSFLANTLLLYPQNPMPGENVRKVNTSLKRDIHKSFFNLIWKNIYQGMQKTALRNNKVVSFAKKKNKAKYIINKLFKKKKH